MVPVLRPSWLTDFVQTWGDPNGLTHWPTDATRDILPVTCHSHNDYWRPVPLFSALNAGCISVEADVWLIDYELYIAHSRSAVAPNRTLYSLYVDPLVELLDKQNPIPRFHPAKDQSLHGVFDTNPSQTLVLLIDFKTDGLETLPHVVSQLSPLRDGGYLSYWNGVDFVEGPVTVVATGNAPFDLLTANSSYRDVFFDAPLDMMEDGEPIPLRKRAAGQEQSQGNTRIPSVVDIDTFNPSNSYYASVSFRKSIGYPWHLHITADQLRHIRAQINGAHRRGLKVRYWGTPSWPGNLRYYIWSILEREGADILNVDDLKSATGEDWRQRASDWWF
ncbi:hypothetical protein BGW36DRAFT_398149 [Talaromyces proteolyticus]|uniref:Altered inheritance of mitochondria protein 6 n=1 Tax=Talaromyces proteolyticus TaxID=1131652 RepID=A0AAD4KQG7_9EURO|nr:uncharacterized protein BGW36DRAFT_398149 [Talaromyces proteolyticus]KAH8696663.1 hypothetical protein BGW36DRAFT_398149 [Talaromyces proteolyticus]